MRWVLVVLLVACGNRPAARPASADFDPPAPTLRMPRHFTPASYHATLAIDPALPTIAGTIEIAGTLDRRSAVIWLHARDLVVKRATANGAAIAAKTREGLLELRGPFAAGPVKLVIEYEVKIAASGVRGVFRNEHAGKPYVYTYFEPIHARRAFPCIDEPDRKTPWTLAIEVPAGNTAVSNTAAVSSTPAGGGRTRVTFAPTKPLPSYLVAFGVGPFEIVDAGRSKSGVPLRIVVPQGEGKRTAYAASALPRIVDMLEAYFDVPHPYAKLDVLVAPRMAGGAMEHAGLITADAINVLLDPQPSWRDRRNVIITVGHEASHQWFGDLVTPAWFDDTWLKEGFATWMEYKVTAALEPAWHDDRGSVTRRNIAFSVDSQAAARAVRQPVANTDGIQDTFDTISYVKGAAIIRMFERYIGEESFRRALRDYFRTYAHGVASYADFIASLERSTGKRLAAAFSSFLEQPGVPVIDAKLACDGAPRISVAQRRYLGGSKATTASAPWHIPVCVAFEQAGKRAQTCALLESERAEIALPSCPRWWMLGNGGVGYYYTNVGAAEVATLRDRAWPVLEHAERRALVEDVRAQVMVGALPAGLLMSFVPKLVAAGDRHSVGDALGDLSSGEADAGGHGVPFGLEAAIAPDLAPALAVWTRKQFGPLAHARGFVPVENESLDEEATRRILIRTVGAAGDPAIVKRAVELAAQDRDMPAAIRTLVLPIAANADPETSARLRAEALAESDRARRMSMLEAISAVDDPQRAAELDVLLDPKLAAEDILFALIRPGRGRASERQVSNWLRANFKAVLAKFPVDEGSFAYFLVRGITTCEAAKRDEAVAFLRDNFSAVPHTRKLVQQQTERIDQCIAQRALVGPSLREWLRTAR